MNDPTEYSIFGQQQTGFRSAIEHSMFGHFSNIEYSQMLQSEEFQVGCSGVYQCFEKCFEGDFLEIQEHNQLTSDYLPY